MTKWLNFLVMASLLFIGCRRSAETAIDRMEPASTANEGNNIRSVDPHVRMVLDQIISIVLSAPELKSSREFYGTADDSRCALVSNENQGVPWPEWYTPNVSGISFVRTSEASDVGPVNRRLLGIRIDKLDLDDQAEEADFPVFGGPVQVTLLNAGGDPEGVIVAGGANVYFCIVWENRKPKLVFNGLLDS